MVFLYMSKVFFILVGSYCWQLLSHKKKWVFQYWVGHWTLWPGCQEFGAVWIPWTNLCPLKYNTFPGISKTNSQLSELILHFSCWCVALLSAALSKNLSTWRGVCWLNNVRHTCQMFWVWSGFLSAKLTILQVVDWT